MSMMVYSGLQVQFIRNKYDIQIQRYETSVLSNIIIYIVKSVDKNNKMFMRL